MRLAKRRLAAAESRANRRLSGTRLLRCRRANQVRSAQQQATRDTLRQEEENKQAELRTPRDRLFLRALEAVRSGTRDPGLIPLADDDMNRSTDEESFTPVQPPIV